MQCQLCNRETDDVTHHHLIPKSRSRGKEKYSFEEKHTKVALCRDCHAQIHAIIDLKTLAKEYNTIEKIKQHIKIANYIKWIQKRSATSRIKIKHNKKKRL